MQCKDVKQRYNQGMHINCGGESLLWLVNRTRSCDCIQQPSMPKNGCWIGEENAFHKISEKHLFSFLSPWQFDFILSAMFPATSVKDIITMVTWWDIRRGLTCWRLTPPRFEHSNNRRLACSIWLVNHGLNNSSSSIYKPVKENTTMSKSTNSCQVGT